MKKILMFTFLSCFLIVVSCKKNEQSCTDGIFDPEKEEQTDCGGVCPPCDFSPTVVDSYVSADINNNKTDFNSFHIDYSSSFIFNFKNDTIEVALNFGGGDTLGGRPIEAFGSSGILKNVPFSTLMNGFVVLSDVNMEEKHLSGYFQAKFLSSFNNYDTLFITNGEFENVKWE